MPAVVAAVVAVSEQTQQGSGVAVLATPSLEGLGSEPWLPPHGAQRGRQL